MISSKKQPSISRNYIFNTLLTVMNILFPLVTFPYISRIIGPEGLGKFGLANSISNYFIMLATFGIPLYGTREIAFYREDRPARSRVFSSLFMIGLASTLVSLTMYAGMFLFVEKMRSELSLYIVFGVNIILTAFSIDWFYQGMENYGFITVRSLVFKLVSFILIFLCIHKAADYVWYAGILVLALSGSNIWNMLMVGKYADLKLKSLEFRKHFKPLLFLILTGIVGSVYNILDTTLLGFMSNDKAVGYYVMDRKLTTLAITFVVSLGTVLVPRLSYYIKNNRSKDYRDLAEKSINFIYFLSIPAITAILLLSNEILSVFGGDKFIGGSLSLMLICPILLITSLDSFLGFQVLIPNSQEKKMLISNCIGAVVNLTCNLLLIPRFQQNGTAIAILISETAVFFSQLYLGRKYLNFRFINPMSFNYFAGILFVIAGVILARLISMNPFIILGTAGVFTLLTYGLFLLFRRDVFAIMIIRKIQGLNAQLKG